MSTEDHTRLVHAVRLALGKLPDFRLWQNSRVTFVKGVPRAKPGLGTGSSDMIGVLAPTGRMVALEAKTGAARLTREQVLFLNLVRKMGGFATVVRSVEDAHAALERARAGERE